MRTRRVDTRGAVHAGATHNGNLSRKPLQMMLGEDVSIKLAEHIIAQPQQRVVAARSTP